MTCNRYTCSGKHTCHPVTPSEKRCERCGEPCHPGDGMKDHPCAHHLPTPSAPTPGEVEGMSIQQAINKIEDWIGGNVNPLEDRGDGSSIEFDSMGLTRFLRTTLTNLLSSRASKAREEGRKEGEEEQWKADCLTIRNAYKTVLGQENPGLLEVMRGMNKNRPSREEAGKEGVDTDCCGHKTCCGNKKPPR